MTNIAAAFILLCVLVDLANLVNFILFLRKRSSIIYSAIAIQARLLIFSIFLLLSDEMVILNKNESLEYMQGSANGFHELILYMGIYHSFLVG